MWIRIRIWIRGSSLWLRVPDPDTAIFVINLQDANKNKFKKVFLPITFWRYIYIIFPRWKVKKKSQSSRNWDFSYYCCLVRDGAGAGSIPLTKESEYRRPKNIQIRIRQHRQHVIKKSQDSWNQGYSQFFACWWNDPEPDPDPDDQICTNKDGSESLRPNIDRSYGSAPDPALDRLRIRLWIRIRNTGKDNDALFQGETFEPILSNLVIWLELNKKTPLALTLF